MDKILVKKILKKNIKDLNLLDEQYIDAIQKMVLERGRLLDAISHAFETQPTAPTNFHRSKLFSIEYIYICI